MSVRIACFGELLVRLTTPGHERLGQNTQLNIHFGGAEANVAVSLSQFGHDVEMISAVAANPLGASVCSGLMAHGVDVSKVSHGDGRMGLYFLETGAVTRPSRIVYDRANSVFANSGSDSFNWDTLLEGVSCIHVSGITPATGPGPAAAARNMAKACSTRGVKLAFDGNYREGLWKLWSGDGPAILREILNHAHIAFINERDIALLLGTPAESRQDAISRAFNAFPNLQYIAATRREQSSVANQQLVGELYTPGAVFVSRPLDMVGVVYRIGG
jgi:2-dehydro-3-deoxygluconokinase